MNYNKLTKQELLYILQEKTKISAPSDVINYIKTNIKLNPEVEQFGVLFLSNNNSIIKHKVLFIGGVNKTIIDPIVLFRTALKTNRCCNIIIFHNHPSGETSPSDDDIRVTKKIKSAGEIIGLKLIDHIIITELSSMSFETSGYMD